METIIKLIPNLKIFYLILIILIMLIINIILNKSKFLTNYKYLINGISLIMLAILTNQVSDIIEGIFTFNFLSVKLYIIILIITNTITLITMHNNFKLPYRIANYLLFGLITIVFGIILVIILGTKLELLSSNTTKYIIILLNFSTIIFIIYLTIISIIYIVKNLHNTQNVKNKTLSLKQLISKKVTSNNKITPEREITSPNNILSPLELLSIPDKENFSINGVGCSIIFEDSIPENIIKNYQILSNDINAKLVNGYTLDENRLLKSICTKLQTNNLNCINLSNSSLLNKITVEEYNFLKQIFEK